MEDNSQWLRKLKAVLLPQIQNFTQEKIHHSSSFKVPNPSTFKQGGSLFEWFFNVSIVRPDCLKKCNNRFSFGNSKCFMVNKKCLNRTSLETSKANSDIIKEACL